MKKHTIWILTILMALTFLGLLFMQIVYMHNMAKMRYEQFAEAAKQSLYAVSERLLHEETRQFLEEDVDSIQASSIYAQYLGEATPRLGGVRYSFTMSNGLEADLTITADAGILSNLQSSQLAASQYNAYTNKFHDKYMIQKDMINGVILEIMSQASTRPIVERADSAHVSNYLRQEMSKRGLDTPFEFAVVNAGGVPAYRTEGFAALSDDEDNMFVHPLFPHDGPGKQYFLKVYFPDKKGYIFSSMSFMMPMVGFTLVLLVIFVVTIITAFRQKKFSEMKNDFINNMTHEFKTPISSISLAAQMLNDQSVRKSPMMLQQISTVISDETKRLRFQVEKVLQMSMFEGRKASLRLQEVDANSVIYSIVNTFKLKVEKYGGQLVSNLDAMDAIVEVDEMHFTNVIFNLLDNAVKYRREDVPLRLVVTTSDIADRRLLITVEDNGIGISKDNQKRIFEKFFRVSTGNLHDVKGFGLGLAYVHKMITELGGEISVESQLNQGTKFKIILPLTKN